MGHIEGASHDQRLLFPDVLDDYIAEDKPVRFIEAFVDSLDLDTFGFQCVPPAATGRPSYHPGDLLKLYISSAPAAFSAFRHSPNSLYGSVFISNISAASKAEH